MTTLLTLTFTAPRPVSKNATFARGKGRRLYRTPEASAFRSRVAYAAMIAAREAGWPTDIWIPAAVRVTVALYDGRWDAGACDTLIIDAMSRLLYADDRIVSHGPAELPIQDGGGRRAVVTVELLAVRTQASADALRRKSEKTKLARLNRAQKEKSA